MLELVVRSDSGRSEGARPEGGPSEGGHPEGGLLRDGRLIEYLPGDDSGVGDVHLGRVLRIDRALGGAMVEIGASAPAWLPVRELPREAGHEGARLIVRIKRAAHDDKGPRVTTRIDEGLAEAVAERARSLEPPALLHARPPLERILGPALAAGCRRIVAADHLSTLRLRRSLEDGGDVELVREEGAWDAVEEELMAALEAEVLLPGGGVLTVERTRAMTVIDVDGGARPALEVDLAAADEVARQLRLRRVGGIVVVDFVDLRRPADRERLQGALRRAVEADPEPVEVLAMTRLGLVQMTRRRTGPSLDELLRRPCPACGGVGRVPRPRRAAER